MRSPLVINRGMASVEDVLGTGVDWDEAAVARYAV
jgi:L-alanine-DL-glutamate epimerase-like enolase superfamily enzyme